MKKTLRHAVEQQDLPLIRNILIKMAGGRRLSAGDLEAITETLESTPGLFETSDDPLPRPEDYAEESAVDADDNAETAEVEEDVVEVVENVTPPEPMGDEVLAVGTGYAVEEDKPKVADTVTEEIVVERVVETYSEALCDYLRKHFTLPAFEALVEQKVVNC